MLRILTVFVALSRLLGATGGNISGTIADPTGAMAPGVAVNIRNVETGMALHTATNDQGLCLLRPRHRAVCTRRKPRRISSVPP
jgi:hypothetical protein